MRNISAFLAGFGLIFFVALSSEAFAETPFYKYNGSAVQNSFGGSVTFSVDDSVGACQRWIEVRDSETRGFTIASMNVEFSPGMPASGPLCTVLMLNGSTYNVTYSSLNVNEYCSGGATPTNGECPTGTGQQPPSNCPTDIIAGGPVMSGFGSGIYDVEGCAYSCSVDMEKMDGNTSFYDAMSCTGLGQDYTTSDSTDYTDVPAQEQCIIDGATGKQMCLSDNEGCYVVDGKEECPEPAEVCGIQNGAWACVNPEQEGCGYFNGQKICYDPDGNKVDNTSPDHPDNGGNLDGDESNDMLDPRDPVDGGDPDNQVDPVLEPTTDADRATEKTARNQLRELQKINSQLDKMNSGTMPSSDLGANVIDGQRDQLINSTGIDGLTQGIDQNPFSPTDLNPVTSVVDGILPTGACTPFSMDVLGHGTFSVSCEDTALLRTILEWVLYVLTAAYLFHLVTTSNRSA